MLNQNALKKYIKIRKKEYNVALTINKRHHEEKKKFNELANYWIPPKGEQTNAQL